MHPKDYIEKLAKDNAFEYDLAWWGAKPRKMKETAKNGDVVAFYRNHHVFNGVVALWARDNSHAIIFYATPHDVEDEKKYDWVPPIFRLELNCQYIYDVPKGAKALDPEADEAEAEMPVVNAAGHWGSPHSGPVSLDEIWTHPLPSQGGSVHGGLSVSEYLNGLGLANPVASPTTQPQPPYVFEENVEDP